MFTQKCFIRKNSKELQDKVYRLGHRDGTHLWESTFNTLLIVNEGYFRCYDDEWGNADSLIRKGYIDCGTNEDLFLALAALRNDTDNNQWFVIDVDVYLDISKGDWFKATDINGGYHVGTQIEPLYCHKATVEELIEHFKSK